MHAVQVDAFGGRRAHRGLRIARRHADQQRCALLRHVGAQLAHRLAGNQRHLAHVTQAGQIRRAQVRQDHVGVLTLAI
ncbi:hypothetical protein G6F22_016495 [Rhizopus arrhizus]|uniref:Uncharacterized protein n=1 Tax=Rhizopus oryzae TaxID=64495 RepID=A0A9P6WSB2_RHIOR|nr:hypothetical protein G6F24_015911 [Rhizopus arrhizus]KAG0771412.1 hypothetical protein G6F22_016495 [Rhizopus arrhizus]KAG1076946.1 hypothetical protein G6F40_017216 [Rhizopus arrhizus]KAG1274805.1 hypothetical protein G6F64_015036 [Rhizopus arrhizus]